MSITIRFKLSEAGQRNALKSGRNAEQVQEMVITPESSCYETAVDLSEVNKDGKAVLIAGSSKFSSMPDSFPVWEYDEFPTVGKLVQDTVDFYNRKKEREAQEEAKKKAEHEELVQRVLTSPLEDLYGGSYDRYSYNYPLSVSDVRNDERVQSVLQKVDSEISRLETEYKQKIKARQKAYDEACAKAEREKAEWIESHGSNRLKRMIKEDIECEAVYRDERLEADRPGWEYSDNCRGEYDDPRNVPEDAFNLLDEARKTEPDAKLVYWTVEHICDPEDFDPYYESPKYDWTGYVAVSEFLDKEIVFGLPTEYVS